MRLGPISAATVIVRSLDQALAAYVNQLGLVLVGRERVPRQRALDMGDAALADAPSAGLRSAADVDPWLTLVEMPEATLTTAFSRRGWQAISLRVSDVDALAAHIDRRCWHVLSEPAAHDDGLRTLVIAGADGEVVQLTAVVHPSATCPLPLARCPVDRIGGAVLGARDCAAALGFYEGLGLVGRWRGPMSLPVDASAQQITDQGRAMAQLRGSNRLDINQMPWLPAADSTLRTGIRLISFERSDASGRRLLAGNDPSARILAGPEGEAIELV